MGIEPLDGRLYRRAKRLPKSIHIAFLNMVNVWWILILQTLVLSEPEPSILGALRVPGQYRVDKRHAHTQRVVWARAQHRPADTDEHAATPQVVVELRLV